MNMASASRSLDEATDDNMASLIQQVKEQNIEIARLKAKLRQSKQRITISVINSVSFDNFIGYTQTMENELHQVQSEFYAKVADFLGLYVKLKKILHELKVCQKNNEMPIIIVDNIETF